MASPDTGGHSPFGSKLFGSSSMNTSSGGGGSSSATGSSSFFKRSITSNPMSSTTITGKSSIKRDVGIKVGYRSFRSLIDRESLLSCLLAMNSTLLFELRLTFECL